MTRRICVAKVSIIVPVYNTEQYLRECLDSLLEQTYKDIEIIVVDDYSNMECKKIIHEYVNKDHRVKPIELNERKGVGYARNAGVQKAAGDFIYFMDSDDYLPNKTIELLAKNIKQHSMIAGKIRETYFNKSMAIILDGIPRIKLYHENRFHLIKNLSALNWLIRRDFIEEHQLEFSEDTEAFSDLAFMIPALIENETVPYLKEGIYFKRKRNDPILNPSLMQGDRKQIIEDFLHVYMSLKEQYSANGLASEYLDKQFLNFYRETVVRFFKEDRNIDLVYDLLQTAARRVNRELINRYDYFLKREINTLRKRDIRQFERLNHRYQLLREIKVAVKGRRKLYLFLYNRIFTKLPVKKNTVFLESFLGKSYSDNPKYIYEYMINHSENYKYIWSFRERKNIPGNPIQVKRFSLKYFYHLARANYWVSNSRLPKDLKKREETIYLQTWHGTPLKKLVFDMKDVYSADPNYKKNFYNQSRRWDYLNSANAYSSEIFRRAFLYDKEILEFGYPRNDILYQKNNVKDIEQLKRKLNLPLDKKVILYAPTWRDDEFFGKGKYKFNLQLDLDKLKEELGDEYIILLRMHYFIANQLDISEHKGFAYDFSSYDDIAELYLISDLLITDYSSVFFDYANLRRPILFYTYDLEKYRDTLRGFYIDIEKEVPGPLLKTTEEVIDSIQNIEQLQTEYKDKYDEFYKRFCDWDDGNASERTVKAVFHDFR